MFIIQYVGLLTPIVRCANNLYSHSMALQFGRKLKLENTDSVSSYAMNLR